MNGKKKWEKSAGVEGYTPQVAAELRANASKRPAWREVKTAREIAFERL